jgi:hypothetical protein
MKKLLLSAILLCGTVMFTMAGPVQTKIIPQGGPVLTVTVLSGQVLHILNFVSESATFRGTVSVTIGSISAPVMESIPESTQESHIVLNLAGPATIRVYPSEIGHQTISYNVDSNM